MNRIISLLFSSNKNNKNNKIKKERVKKESTQVTSLERTIKSNKKASILPNSISVKAKEELTIKRIESIPFYLSILTRDNGDISLSTELKNDYIVLLTDTENKEVIVICSLEATPQTGFDHNFTAIKEKCKAKGYLKIKQNYANRQLIRLLYEKEIKEKSLEEQVKDADGLEKDFDALLKESLEQGVSDIHIEVRRDTAEVRSRRNGALRLDHEWSVSYARQMAVVIYQVIAEEKDVTFVETMQQSAIIDRQIGDQRVRVRLNTMPAYPNGFDVVMRILRMGISNTKKTLSMLGYSEPQVCDINFSLSKPVGVTIIAGTTGSGKSTSLTTMISNIIDKYTDDDGCRIKVITVEDPPEYQIVHATQCPVVRSKNNKNGKNPFADAIRAAMRSDPDVLMVGEVRDEDSSELLVHAVQSGHQAFTTVHAASTFGIISRLRSFGVKHDVLGSSDFIAGLIYQALIPVTCPECGLTIEQYMKKNNNKDSENRLNRIKKVSTQNQIEKIRFINGCGCEKCDKGIVGRTVVAEVVVPDQKMIEYFFAGHDDLARKYFKECGGKSVLHHGISKMNDGICDPFEIEHKLGLLDAEINNQLQITNNINANDDSLVEEKDIELESLNLQSSLLKNDTQESLLAKIIDFNKTVK